MDEPKKGKGKAKGKGKEGKGKGGKGKGGKGKRFFAATTPPPSLPHHLRPASARLRLKRFPYKGAVWQSTNNCGASARSTLPA